MRQYLNREFLLSHKQLLIKAAIILGLIMAAFFSFTGGGGRQGDAVTEAEVMQESLTGSQAEAAGEGKAVPDSDNDSSGSMGSAVIIVDVGGAVQTPQVVQLKANSRVADAVDAAGGLTDEADTAGINQAAFLSDGEKVYIPAKGEDPSLLAAQGLQGDDSADRAGGTGLSGSDGRIDLNTATAEELQTLNGVGPVTAEKILAYRSSNGYFQRIEELKHVEGIGEKTFERLKEHIKV